MRVEVVGNRMSYIFMRRRWCNIIVLNVHQVRRKVMIKKAVFMRN